MINFAQTFFMNLTTTDIFRIAQSSERETITTELKSFRKLIPFDDNQKRDIAYEIIAFANRHGGQLIFGINDNGKPDENIDIDIDVIKSKLHQLCFDSISPVIECTTQYIDEAEGRFFIAHIPKRKRLPHAYVPNWSGSDINSRIYYIRTSHGKKLVSDSQLEWLFQNQGDPVHHHNLNIPKIGGVVSFFYAADRWKVFLFLCISTLSGQPLLKDSFCYSINE